MQKRIQHHKSGRILSQGDGDCNQFHYLFSDIYAYFYPPSPSKIEEGGLKYGIKPLELIFLDWTLVPIPVDWVY